jgi:hypothetical protein
MAAAHTWPVLRVTAPGHPREANALGHLPGLGRAAITAALSAVVRRGRGDR